ncbi:alpha/beta fold hydrolase [Leucobacter sp. W1038]|uniref:alpha/beta fold hydrolase n=1 Tax=Leucobacter sp. W1038 TaxID=3438281 RepID=UPI003D990A2A
MKLYPNLIEREIDINGSSVKFLDSISGAEKATIVLVHGTGSTIEKNFWALFPMLAFQYRVVGINLSQPASDASLSVDDYVEQVHSVIEETSPGQKVVLVGYSLGAVIAIAAAARYPRLVDQLVSIAGWMKTDRHQAQRLDLYDRLVESAPDLVPSFTQFASYSSSYISGRTQNEYEELLERSGSVNPYPQPLIQLLRSIDIEQEACVVDVPTLVIGCSHDQMVQVGRSREIFGAIKNSRYAEVPAGHAVVHERPAELFALIDQFIERPDEYAPGSVYSRTIA